MNAIGLSVVFYYRTVWLSARFRMGFTVKQVQNYNIHSNLPLFHIYKKDHLNIKSQGFQLCSAHHLTNKVTSGNILHIRILMILRSNIA